MNNVSNNFNLSLLQSSKSPNDSRLSQVKNDNVKELFLFSEIRQ
jgi:hypothetical protein